MTVERPSLIADDPVPTTVGRKRMPRWLGAVVAVAVLGGFGAGVGYVYWHVTRAGDGGTVPLVRAETSPIRVRPDNPGGLEVPHQNIDIFNRIGQPAPAQPRPQVERLLPPPEPPMPRPPAPSEARAPQPTPPQAGAPRPPLSREQAQPLPVGPGPVAQAPAQAPVAQPPAPTAPAQVTNVPAAGGIRVQLASMQTQEGANTEMQRLRRTQTELLRNLTLTVVRAEVAGRTMYRLQAGPLRDRAAAETLCQTLTQRRVGCTIVQ